MASTVQRELGTLTKMLWLAYKNKKLLRLPLLDKPKEGPACSGFFEKDQFSAVRRHLPDDLQVAVSIAYTYGWRMQSEVLALERRIVDLASGTLRLDLGTTKNGAGRVVYLTPEIRRLVTDQLGRVDELKRELKRIIPYVFPHFAGSPQSRGARRCDLRKAWATACAAAAVPDVPPRPAAHRRAQHDGGGRERARVAMEITGHKTRSVFDRYNIVSAGNLAEAARKMDSVAFPVASAPGARNPVS